MRFLSWLTAFVVFAAFSPIARADALFNLSVCDADSNRGDQNVFLSGWTDSDQSAFRAPADREFPSERQMPLNVRLPEIVRLSESRPQLHASTKGITPIPEQATDVPSISTFSQFVQLFKSSTSVESESSERVSEITREILPKAFNLTIFVLFFLGFAGTCSVISMSRVGIFGRTACQ